MSMPKRWLDHDGPPEFLRLLKAARNEPVPRRAMERAVLTVTTTTVLGTVAGGALGATAKAATTSLGWAFAKWGAAAVLGLGLATTTAATVHHLKVTSKLPAVTTAHRAAVPGSDRAAASIRPRPAGRSSPDENDGRGSSPLPFAAGQDSGSPSLPRSVSGQALGTSVPPPFASAQDHRLSPPPPVDSAFKVSTQPSAARAIAELRPDLESRSPVGPRRIVAAPLQTQIRPVSDAQLLEELRWIDRASAALRNGEPSVTLELLDDYQRHCPAQRLLPEALLLRVQAASRLSNHAAAHKAANEIEARYPSSPHVQKARELVGSGSPTIGE